MKNGEKTSAHMRWEGRDIAVSGAVDSKAKIDKLMPGCTKPDSGYYHIFCIK